MRIQPYQIIVIRLGLVRVNREALLLICEIWCSTVATKLCCTPQRL